MSVGWDYNTRERRRRLAASQPLPRARWNLALVGAALAGAGLWGLIILFGRILWRLAN